MANSYSFNQIATILNSIVADAQGRTANIATTPRNSAEFVTMATTALSAGTDPIMNSLNQMINKTIFAYRPYNRKFQIMERNDLEFGNAIRKVTPIFTDGAENQPMYNNQPADGQATDHWTIKRPKTVQTNFIGAEQWEVQAPTVFVDQLNNAFRGPDELAQFISAQVGEVSNEIEQQTEQLARMTAVNMMGAIIHSNAPAVVHLLTEYNAATGLSLTATSVYQPANFPGFIKWVYARIEAVSEQMTERSTKFHKSLTNATILRHTPKEYQRLLVYAPAMAQIETMVLSGLYHENLLKMGNYESVNFWQNLNQPEGVNVTAKYMDADGTVSTSSAVKKDHVFGILYDRDAMGINVFNQGVNTTPINAKGRYYNTFHHFTKRFYNDMTENAVVFLLD